MYKIEPPLLGPWEYGLEFPGSFELEGKTFERAIRAQGYDGVIAQYREAVPRDSAHLLVLDDGNWIIDHVDEYNPDRGHPVRHWIVDHPAGKGSVIAAVGVLGIAGSAIAGKMQKDRETP